jgi:HEAT repeat protein
MRAQRIVHGFVFAGMAGLAVTRALRAPLTVDAVLPAVSLCVAAGIANRLSRTQPKSALLTIPLLGWFRLPHVAVAAIAALLVVFPARPDDPPMFGFRRVRLVLKGLVNVPLGLGVLAWIFGRVWWNSTATPATRRRLVEDLKGTDPSVRRDAMDRLSRIAHPDTAPALVAALGDADESITRQARDTLARMDSSILPLVLDAIPGAKGEATEALWYVAGKIGDGRALAPAVAAMAVPRGKGRAAAADALDLMIDLRSKPLDRGAVRDALLPMEPVLRGLVKDRNADIRRASVMALGLIGEHASTTALLGVYRDDDENENIRDQAALALGRVGGHEAVDDLVTGLAVEALQDPCGRALRMLNRGRAELIARLDSTEVDEDWDEPLRLRAIRSFGPLGDPDSAPVLVELTTEADPRARAEAATSIGGLMNYVWNAPMLNGNRLPLPLTDDEGFERLKTILLPALEPMLQDQDASVRRAAVLAFVWPEDSLAPLENDADEYVRDAVERQRDRRNRQ